LTSQFISPPPAAGAFYTIQTNVTLPATTGSQYLIFVTNRDRVQSEADAPDYTNDFVALPITISAPDLLVSSASAPASIAAGQSFAVQWTMSNQGSGGAYDSWYDSVYLSKTQTVDGSAVNLTNEFRSNVTPLAAGDSYTVNTSLTLSSDVSGGSKYLI